MRATLFICCLVSSLFLTLNPALPQSITAKYKLEAVDSFVHSIDPTAKLRWLMSDSVLADGTSESWKYQYDTFSGYIHTSYFLHATIDSVALDSINYIAPLGIMYVDSIWIDSDIALSLAESQGGEDFRNTHTDYKIFASMGKPLVPYSTNRWYIHYISLEDESDRIFINLDATADTVVGVKNMEAFPNDFNLYQNYPNPFNSSTTISFDLPHSGYVELKIYSALGKDIRTLISENKDRGSFRIDFNGYDLASGIYFYKLNFDSITGVRKLVLIK